MQATIPSLGTVLKLAEINSVGGIGACVMEGTVMSLTLQGMCMWYVCVFVWGYQCMYKHNSHLYTHSLTLGAHAQRGLQ